MKWFQHMSDSHQDLNVEPLIEKYGIEPYGLFWLLCELVGRHGVEFKIKQDRGWQTIARNRSKLPEERFKSYCDELANLDLINKKAYEIGDLYIPKMANYSDDYTKKVRRVSEQDTDNVAQSRLHNITLHKNTLHNNIYSTITFLKNLPQDDIKELSDKYSVSSKFIKDRADDVIDYCEAKGKVYKDYKAALRNFIKSHLQRHPECIVVKKDAPKIEEDTRTPEEKAKDHAKRDQILAEARKKIIKKL